LKFDIAIIGAGFSGLSSALHLSKLGYKVCILDAHRVGWGASGRNGGQVGSGMRIGQDELEDLVGFQRAKQAFEIGVEAADLVRDLIKQHKIECAYKDGNIEALHRKRYDKETLEYVEMMHEKYDYHSLSYLTPQEMSEKVGSSDYSAGALDTRCGHLHPLNYARGLAQAAMNAGAEIFEMSRVKHFESGKVSTNEADISAEKIILATNGYLGNLDGHVADRVMPINNFIVATEPLSDDMCKSLIRDGECVHDSRFVVNYVITALSIFQATQAQAFTWQPWRVKS